MIIRWILGTIPAIVQIPGIDMSTSHGYDGWWVKTESIICSQMIWYLWAVPIIFEASWEAMGIQLASEMNLGLGRGPSSPPLDGSWYELTLSSSTPHTEGWSLPVGSDIREKWWSDYDGHQKEIAPQKETGCRDAFRFIVLPSLIGTGALFRHRTPSFKKRYFLYLA